MILMEGRMTLEGAAIDMNKGDHFCISEIDIRSLGYLYPLLALHFKYAIFGLTLPMLLDCFSHRSLSYVESDTYVLIV